MINCIHSSYKGYLNREGRTLKIHFLTAIIARIYIAQVFFSAGLAKIHDWETTLFLFKEAYQVPILPFELVAILGTAGELVLSALLFFGILTRFSSLGLFIVNAVAAISLSEITPAALYLHYLWGVLALQILVYGAGPLSIDHIAQKLNQRAQFKANFLPQ